MQVSELRRDGQLHEVLKKNDFSSRIRSAVVLGDSLEHGLDDDAHAGMTNPEKATQFMDYSKTSKKPTRVGHLPPQLLVLMLESGSCIFLFIRDRLAGDLEFFDIKYECPTRLAYLGYHLAVDPSSRYMAAASPDGIFVVYELESLVTLNTQYVTNGTFSPVKSIRYRAIQGVIHKLEFLYPRPEDDYHIILLLIVIRKERNQRTPISRMVTYEWELGDNLISTFAEEQIGTRLPREHRMPMLLIPLRFKTAFFAVSPLFIGVVKYALSGSPEFELLETDTPRCTKFHHGVCEPLWTSWARPFRRKQYFEKTDIIYLAREDGAIIHIEIDAAELVPSVTNVGCIETNIDTAFTTAYDIFSDVLIIGGDSGPGGVWKVWIMDLTTWLKSSLTWWLCHSLLRVAILKRLVCCIIGRLLLMWQLQMSTQPGSQSLQRLRTQDRELCLITSAKWTVSSAPQVVDYKAVSHSGDGELGRELV